ncbi:MAG: hypothetical protein WBY94_11925 [Polyangiaceae bacterium]
MEEATTIGTAMMKLDGTIVLQLRATNGAGSAGDTRLDYPPGHRQYQGVLKHLGDLKPGEEKSVPSWTE